MDGIRQRQAVLIFAGIVDGAGTWWACNSRFVHYQLAVILLQAAVLLPALWFAFRSGFAEDCSAEPVLTSRIVRTFQVLFLFATLAVSAHVSRGMMIADESAYRFQSRILATGHLMTTPLPGTAETPADMPEALSFPHHVIAKKGWYTKYPLGWPLVLALPEKLGLGWMVTPFLAVLILLVWRAIATEVFDAETASFAVWIAVLSPYVWVNSVGFMPHALSTLLVSLSWLLALRGLRTKQLAPFIAVFAISVVLFHIRPFTAAITSSVLGGFVALAFFRAGERTLAFRIVLAGAICALLAAVTVLGYNWLFTGSPTLSPYALYRGTGVPIEVSASRDIILRNVSTTWRWALQATLVYSFVFVFIAAGFGLRLCRKRPEAWLLALPFPALLVGHLIQVESSAAMIGERYWFEGYFGVVILAAHFLVWYLREQRVPRALRATAVWTFTGIQIACIVASIGFMSLLSQPGRALRTTYETLAGQKTVVFIQQAGGGTYGQNINLNQADWQSQNAIALLDPGPALRQHWAELYGRTTWSVIRYDPSHGNAPVIDSSSAK